MATVRDKRADPEGAAAMRLGKAIAVGHAVERAESAEITEIPDTSENTTQETVTAAEAAPAPRADAPSETVSAAAG
jgi:hypothetical protein